MSRVATSGDAPVAVSALALISIPPPDLETSPELKAAWEAEEAALEHDDVDAAVKAVVDAWTLPDAPAGLRERVGEMERRVLALQSEAAGATKAPDPLERDPDALARIDVPVLVAAGERERFADFREGAETLARRLPQARLAVIEGAGHLAPVETLAAFRTQHLGFLHPRAG